MDKREYLKRWALNRKSKGLCLRCGKQKIGSISVNCNECKEFVNKTQRFKRLQSPKCTHCWIRNKSNGKSLCEICLIKNSDSKKAKYKTEIGLFLSLTRTRTRDVANGSYKNSKRVNWDHEDFAKAFPSFPESGKDIDHIIPLVCADAGDGKLDKDFLDLASGLENLQLLTRSENVTKAANLDRQIIARAKDLRQQGKSGADLFHQLWAEFAWPQRQEG